jgi:hypothetical protein
MHSGPRFFSFPVTLTELSQHVKRYSQYHVTCTALEQKVSEVSEENNCIIFSCCRDRCSRNQVEETTWEDGTGNAKNIASPATEILSKNLGRAREEDGVRIYISSLQSVCY